MTWVAAGAAVVGTGLTAYQASKANKAQNKQSGAADAQARIAQQMFEESGPLREKGQSDLYAFLANGWLPSSIQGPEEPPAEDFGLSQFARGYAGIPYALKGSELPQAPRRTAPRPTDRPKVADMTAYDRDVLEKQFSQAKGNLYANSPNASGALEANLGNLESERALGVTGLYSRQNALQYQADLDAAAREDAYNQQNYQADVTADEQTYNALLQDRQRENQLRSSLFGSAVDISQQQKLRDRELRKALFSSALGLGSQDANSALAGLSGASSGYGNVASSALKGTDMAMDATGTALGFAIPALVNRQQSSAPSSANNYNDYYNGIY